MSKDAKLKELVAANHQAHSEMRKVESAIDLVRQRRAAGKGPKEYELAMPFGNRSWVRHVRLTPLAIASMVWQKPS